MGLNPAKKFPGRCTKAVLGALGVVLLAAVPALGLTALGPNFLPNGQAADEGVVAVSNGPLTFDAPLVELRKTQPSESRDGQPAGAEDASVVLADWKFTGTFPNTTGFEVLAANLNVLYQKNPLLFLYVASLVPGIIDENLQGTLQSLSPEQKFALVAVLFFLLSNNPGAPQQAPTPASPSH